MLFTISFFIFVNTAMGKLKKKVPHSSMDSDSDGTDDLSCEDINGDVCKVFFLFWIVLPGCFCIQRTHHFIYNHHCTYENTGYVF
jgi:hypothetical protein